MLPSQSNDDIYIADRELATGYLLSTGVFIDRKLSGCGINSNARTEITIFLECEETCFVDGRDSVLRNCRHAGRRDR